MKPDNINAAGMILMVVFTAAIVFFFRTKPLRNVSWIARIPLAIGGCVFAFFLFSMDKNLCIEIPEPFGQFVLTALCLFLIIALVDINALIILSCIVVLLIGTSLEKHFNNLVRYSDGYTTIDANTHKPMTKGCSEMKTSASMVPDKLWHTWFTGIYGIKK